MRYFIIATLLLFGLKLSAQNFTDICSYNSFSNVYAVSADSLGNTWFLEGDSTNLFRIDSLRNLTNFSYLINGVTNSKLTAVASLDGVVFVGTLDDYMYRVNPDSGVVQKFEQAALGPLDSTINSISIFQRNGFNRMYIASPFQVFKTNNFASTIPPFFVNSGIPSMDKKNFRLMQNKEMDECIDVNGIYQNENTNNYHLISFGATQYITGTLNSNKPISATLNIQASSNFCSNNQSIIADSYGVYVAIWSNLWDTLIHNIDVVDMVLRDDLAFIASRDSGLYTTNYQSGTSQKVLDLPSDLKINDLDLTYNNGIALATNKGVYLISDSSICDNYQIEILTLQDTVNLEVQDTIQMYSQGCIANHNWSLGTWSSSAQSPVYTFSDTGTYTFLLNGDNNVCFADTFKQIYVQGTNQTVNCDSFVFSIENIPDSIEITSDSMLVITSLSFTDSIRVNTLFSSSIYVDSVISIPIYNSGDYTIDIFGYLEGCIDTISINVQFYDGNISTGLPNHSSTANAKLFPNPIENAIKIESKFELGLIQILDLKGSMVFSNHYYEKQVELDLSEFPNGYFIIRVNDEEYKILK